MRKFTSFLLMDDDVKDAKAQINYFCKNDLPAKFRIFDEKSKQYKPFVDLTNHKWISDRAIFNKSANKTICWFDNEKYISTNTDKIYDFRVGFGACYYKHLTKLIKQRGYSKSQLKFLENFLSRIILLLF